MARREISVLAALRPLTPETTVRGQYHGYRAVDGVEPQSTTETYAAIRLDLESCRWSGVPLLIRAGKCLPVTATGVDIRFHRPPHDVPGLLFGAAPPETTNALRFRIRPNAQTTIVIDFQHEGRPLARFEINCSLFLWHSPGLGHHWAVAPGHCI